MHLILFEAYNSYKYKIIAQRLFMTFDDIIWRELQAT